MGAAGSGDLVRGPFGFNELREGLSGDPGTSGVETGANANKDGGAADGAGRTDLEAETEPESGPLLIAGGDPGGPLWQAGGVVSGEESVGFCGSGWSGAWATATVKDSLEASTHDWPIEIFGVRSGLGMALSWLELFANAKPIATSKGPGWVRDASTSDAVQSMGTARLFWPGTIDGTISLFWRRCASSVSSGGKNLSHPFRQLGGALSFGLSHLAQRVQNEAGLVGFK